MPDRRCQTCKFFEPSAVPNKGWCRNPALFAPQQSHAVAADTLDCAKNNGQFWEAVPGTIDDSANNERVTGAIGERRRLRLFQPPPQLVPAGAGMFASYGGGDDSGNRDDPRSSGRNSGSSQGQATPD